MDLRGGTLLERIIAYWGIALLGVLTLVMASTAVDPRFGLTSPMWLGSLLPVSWGLGALQQLRAWDAGAPASRLLDPVRARFGLRALPNLAWLAAGALTVIGAYALLALTGGIEVDAGVSGRDDTVYLVGAIVVGGTLYLWLDHRSDVRDRRAREAAGVAPPTPPPIQRELEAAKALPTSHAKVLRSLGLLAVATSGVGLLLSFTSGGAPGILLVVSLVVFGAWIAYSTLVVRPALRRLQRELPPVQPTEAPTSTSEPPSGPTSASEPPPPPPPSTPGSER